MSHDKFYLPQFWVIDLLSMDSYPISEHVSLYYILFVTSRTGTCYVQYITCLRVHVILSFIENIIRPSVDVCCLKKVCYLLYLFCFVILILIWYLFLDDDLIYSVAYI